MNGFSKKSKLYTSLPPPSWARFRYWFVFIFFALYFSLNLNNAIAVDGRNGLPVKINARTMEVNQKTGDNVYRGKVTIKQGNLRIRADMVETKTKGRTAQVIKAYGNPVFLRQVRSKAKGDIVATAKEMRYHIVSKKIMMRGDVQFHRSEGLIKSDVMEYDMINETLVAKSEKSDARVEAVFHPNKSPPESSPSQSSVSGAN